MSAKPSRGNDRGELEEGRPKYEYDPLPSKNHTRLITLFPRSEGEEICIDLEIVNINEAINTYEAISYAWGSTETVDINCGGGTMSIRTRLAEAIHAFRYPTITRCIWADAICIDQENDREKGHQVKRMGNIFENATRILAWLGHDDEMVATDCFTLIKDTNRYMGDRLEKWGDPMEIPTILHSPSNVSDPARWAKVRKFIALSWFRRMWIIQEAGLAKACSLFWGEAQISIAELVELAHWKSYRDDLAYIIGEIGFEFLFDLFADVYCSYTNTDTWRTSMPLIKAEYYRSVGRKNLYSDALMAGSGMLASDPRDFVYALLGSPLARFPNGEFLVEPDYEKSLPEVYFDMASALLRHPRETQYVLSRVKYRSDERPGEDSDFPTWIPRWNAIWVRYTISRPKFWFCTGGKVEFEPEILKDRSLAIRGFVFDKLLWRSEMLKHHNFVLALDEWDENTRNTGEPAIDTLWKEVAEAAGTATKELEHAFGYTLVRAYPAKAYHQLTDAQHEAEFELYRQLARKTADPGRPGLPKDLPAPGEPKFPRNFVHRLKYNENLRLGLVGLDRPALVPNVALPGDLCCVIFGMPVPVILRPTGEDGYHLVGECYVHDIMSGKAIEGLKEGKFKEEVFIIK